ncbi:hypothetical protein M2323_002284 [Rhodoblastus acidophilus]|uniref:PRC-barrel domain-containing protein n=1 Tax=Rhodoblastus acidophilus TaxID=1074 RepID=UPI00222433DB|nr:PRC-barrel domain-containing protein [Rhodoblastus acidophilus]MCW2284506.1 hypothetical protein [Rhodoblastus acidophilus]MCW2333353.1 hypothetical protein [Rhodoblastus acidophilus]
MRQKPALHLACALMVLASAPLRAQDNPPEPAPQKPDTPALETPATVIDGTAAAALLGKPVQSLKAEDLGRVVDVITDRNGVLRAAVVDFGGFLGVGTRKIAVDWRALHFPENGGMDRLIAELPRDKLRTAPIYKEGEPIVVIGAPAQPAEAAPAAPKP